MRVTGCGLVVAMAALGTIGCYDRSGADPAGRPPMTPQPVVNVEAVRPEVEQFCGNCHATPQPTSFPRDRWAHEVDRGYEFYLLSGRSDLKVPKRATVIAYYEQLAPDRLLLPFPVADSHSHFDRLEVAWPDNLTEPAAVAHVLALKPSSEPPGQPFWLCDMRRGTVSWSVMEGSVLEIGQETRLNHPDHAMATDLDGDSRRDYLICDLGSFLPEDHQRGRVVWLRPVGEGESAALDQDVLLEGVGRVADAQAADFDGDGDLDIVVAVFGWHTTGGIILLRQTGSQDGQPQFTPETLDERDGTIHVPVADLNRDGRPDFAALISQEHESVEAFTSREDGKFDKQVIYRAPDPSYGSSGIELVDLDGDGDLDVLYTNGDTFDSYYVKPYHSIRWIENRGEAGWRDRKLADLPGVHRALAGDLDGDGDLDIAACCLISPTSIERQPEITRVASLVWLEQRAGRFVMHLIEADRPIHATLALADVNHDGALDLIVGNFVQDAGDAAPPLSVWINRGQASR